MADLRFDLRIAIRRLTRAPVFAIVAIGTLALAIGATTAIYSIVRSVLLRPIPLPSPDRLVRVYGTTDESRSYSVSAVDLQDFRHCSAFASISGWAIVSAALTDARQVPERMRVAAVTGDFFQTVGIRSESGRLLAASDDAPDSERVVVLGHSLWRHRFGAAHVIGTSIELGGLPYRVIGVAPPGFDYPAGVDLWRALRLRVADLSRGSRFLNGVGRLKPGATLQNANAELHAVAARLEAQYPDTNRHCGARAITVLDDAVGDSRRGLLVLFAVVGFVLLIACTTIANLLLSRALRLGPELSVRAALGAGRLQIIRQLAVEHLLLACAGGAAGFGLAVTMTRLFVGLAPSDFPRLNEIRIDWSVLLFTCAVSVLTAMLFGIAPVVEASRGGIAQGRAVHARGSLRLRSALVISQTALALITLSGALLFTKSFVRLMETNPGFHAEDRFTADISLPSTRYASDAAVEAFYRNLIERVKSHAEVIGCAAAVWRPLDPDNEYDTNFIVRERPMPAGTIRVSFISPITPDYATTMGIPLMKGRLFTTRDTAASPGVMIVNDAWAAQYAPNGNPIGMHVREGVWFGKHDAPRDREIVGMVGNVRQVSLEERPKPMMYVPHAQAPAPDMSIMMRMRPGSGVAAAILRDEVRRLDLDIPLYDATTMTSILSRSVARPRMYAAVNAMLAFLAIVLAVVGVYSVLSFLVIQRQQELGIRMALGAAPDAIVRLVFERGAALVALGTVAGTAGAIGMGRLADALLYDTSSRDPFILLAVAGIVMTAGLAASAIPALRSSRIDPASMLRGDA